MTGTWDAEKQKVYNRKYKEEHREELKKYMEKYYREHLEEYREYYQRHREEVQESREKLRKELKEQIFQKYGTKCNNPNCPIPSEKLDKRCLQIDHVHNNGYNERRMSGLKFLKKVLEDSEGNYQLLCAYCNWLKKMERLKKQK